MIFDRLRELANEHGKLRQMLGHGPYDEYQYGLQTLQDNISLFTPEVLDEISQIVISSGHELVKEKEERLQGRCDSFVVKTNVRFPTDIGLLEEACRKTIETATVLAAENRLTAWKQSGELQRQHKKRYNKLRRLKHSTSSSKVQQQACQDRVDSAYIDYLNRSQKNSKKSRTDIISFGR